MGLRPGCNTAEVKNTTCLTSSSSWVFPHHAASAFLCTSRCYRKLYFASHSLYPFVVKGLEMSRMFLDALKKKRSSCNVRGPQQEVNLIMGNYTGNSSLAKGIALWYAWKSLYLLENRDHTVNTHTHQILVCRDVPFFKPSLIKAGFGSITKLGRCVGGGTR